MCVGSFNILDDLSSRVCVTNETEDLNLHVFNMTTRINESKTLPKHISCKCQCKFHDRKCNLNQKWNKGKCRCEYKFPKEHQCEKGYFLNPAKCSCENRKYGNSTCDLVVICNEIIAETKTIPTRSTSKKTIPTKSTSTNFYISLAFLLITIALLITISIYLIRDQSKQQHLLSFYKTSKLKEIGINNIL